MRCSKARDMFSDYWEDVLQAPARAAFEQHLAECGECRTGYEQFNAALMMLEELPELEVPTGFETAVMNRLEGSRQTSPSPVRWWHLDWQRVFTVRVPAKALAAGLAAVLVVGAAIQFTPVASITSSLLFPPKSVSSPVGSGDPTAPKGVCVPGAQTELTVCVDTSAVNGPERAYVLRFEAKDDIGVKYDVRAMDASAGSPDAAGNLLSSGFVQSKQDASVMVPAGQADVVRIDWQQHGQAYRQFVFLPAAFNPNTAKSLSAQDQTVYGALRMISKTYGVVVIASGDLAKDAKYVNGQNLDDVIYGVARTSGFDWGAVAPGIYVVKPTP